MKIPEWWWEIKRRFTKEHLHLMKVAWKGYAFDSLYLHEVEKAKLQEMSAYFKKSNLVAGTDIMVRDINICVYLIDIMNENYDLIDYDKYFGKNHEKQSFHESMQHADDLRRNNDFSFLKKYVNTKNIKYWCPNANKKLIEFYKRYPEELYKIKAEKLYYKIRQEKTCSWWD